VEESRFLLFAFCLLPFAFFPVFFVDAQAFVRSFHIAPEIDARAARHAVQEFDRMPAQLFLRIFAQAGDKTPDALALSYCKRLKRISSV
jgi:non-ribosomal peptide synthetase component F